MEANGFVATHKLKLDVAQTVLEGSDKRFELTWRALVVGQLNKKMKAPIVDYNGDRGSVFASSEKRYKNGRVATANSGRIRRRSVGNVLVRQIRGKLGVFRDSGID